MLLGPKMVNFQKNILVLIKILILTISWLQTVKSHITQLEHRNAADRQKLHQTVEDVYKGCGFIKHCLKICSSAQIGCNKCISNHNCYAIVTLEHKEDKYHIKMFRQLTENLDFIAFGINNANNADKKATMGGSAIFACVSSTKGSNDQNHFAAFAIGRSLEYDVSQNTYSVPRHTIIESHYLCEFSIKKEFQVRTLKVDLDKNKYFMLAAIGEASTPWELAGHSKSESGRVYTNEKFDWKDVPIIDDYDESYDKGCVQQISTCMLFIMVFVVLIM